MAKQQTNRTMTAWFGHPMVWVLAFVLALSVIINIWQYTSKNSQVVTAKKLYARMLKADCPVDQKSLDTMYPVLQNEVVPHAAADNGFRQIYFFHDRSQTTGIGQLFSITIYDTEADMQKAGQEATSKYRFETLKKINCTPIDARFFDVISGKEERSAKEVVFPAS